MDLWKTDIKISTMTTAKLKADKAQLMCLLVRVITVCNYQRQKFSLYLRLAGSSETIATADSCFKIPVMLCIYILHKVLSVQSFNHNVLA